MSSCSCNLILLAEILEHFWLFLNFFSRMLERTVLVSISTEVYLSKGTYCTCAINESAFRLMKIRQTHLSGNVILIITDPQTLDDISELRSNASECDCVYFQEFCMICSSLSAENRKRLILSCYYV